MKNDKIEKLKKYKSLLIRKKRREKAKEWHKKIDLENIQ